jgi:hypothetical protein
VWIFFCKLINKYYFSSYNKQWQDAQIAMADMLGIETPAQPRAPETVCHFDEIDH